jgi:hypothetical protein
LLKICKKAQKSEMIVEEENRKRKMFKIEKIVKMRFLRGGLEIA